EEYDYLARSNSIEYDTSNFTKVKLVHHVPNQLNPNNLQNIKVYETMVESFIGLYDYSYTDQEGVATLVNSNDYCYYDEICSKRYTTLPPLDPTGLTSFPPGY